MNKPRASLGFQFAVVSLAASLAALGGAACGGGSSSPQPRIPWDWAGIVGTGQSLSVGALGSPLNATAPSANNLKLVLGDAVVPPFDPALPSLTMGPLAEPLRPFAQGYPAAYPGNLDGETPHTAMATQITALVQAAAKKDYVTVHTVVGESGQPMSVINKTATEVVTTNPVTSMGRAYAATLFEAAAIKRIAEAMDKTYGIGAILLTHGESDSGNLNYEADMVQLWSDYNADLPPLTGQATTTKIPLFVSQQNSVPFTSFTSVSTVAQWKVGQDHPGDIVCVGPKYQYPYMADPGSNPATYIHLSSIGYDMLGEKFAQVYFERVVMGRDWQPLQPTGPLEVAGNVITVHFHVPVPPLTWNDYPAPHGAMFPEWAMGRGFEVSAASAPQTIDSVEIVGGDSVKITCRNDLTGNQVTVSYALATEGVARATADGHGTSRWGLLQDSDPFIGATTQAPQRNHCVAFSMTFP